MCPLRNRSKINIYSQQVRNWLYCWSRKRNCLGLSVKWATCNVGANAPEDYGDYYAWGETSTKSSYTRDNCETTGESIINIKGTSRDVARVKWGGTWSMPSRAECEELINECKWTSTTKSGINGYRITGPNGNSIFLPAAGYRGGTDSYDVGVEGYYWCSTSTDGYNLCGSTIFFTDTYYTTNSSSIERFGGLPVRPVTK